MYRAKTLIVHSSGYVCHEGKSLEKCPPALLKQLIKDGLVDIVDGGAPEEMLVKDNDALSRLNRTELINVLKLNNLIQIVGARQSWTDEQIRQGIRNVTPDVDKLVFTAEDLNLLDPKIDETNSSGNGAK